VRISRAAPLERHIQEPEQAEEEADSYAERGAGPFLKQNCASIGEGPRMEFTA
jgi:hypothetical protein